MSRLWRIIVFVALFIGSPLAIEFGRSLLAQYPAQAAWGFKRYLFVRAYGLKRPRTLSGAVSGRGTVVLSGAFMRHSLTGHPPREAFVITSRDGNFAYHVAREIRRRRFGGHVDLPTRLRIYEMHHHWLHRMVGLDVSGFKLRP